MASNSPVCPCGAEAYDDVFRYDRPPKGEVCFPSAASGYRRDVLRCRVCGHFVSRHEMDLAALYEGEYVDATYGDDMRRTFDRIVSLPPELSDNEGRARAVCDFALRHFKGGLGVPRLLDVGSGLSVFPYRMAQEGWDCTALDPDARAVRHANEVARVHSRQADFLCDEIAAQYDVVTFNKVLEHVLEPVVMLARARQILSRGGFVYVELPDGEEAVQGGPGREEFFIEHHHIFSMVSMAMLVTRAGFRLIRAERLQEPSGKYTLRGFGCEAR